MVAKLLRLSHANDDEAPPKLSDLFGGGCLMEEGRNHSRHCKPLQVCCSSWNKCWISFCRKYARVTGPSSSSCHPIRIRTSWISIATPSCSSVQSKGAALARSTIEVLSAMAPRLVIAQQVMAVARGGGSSRQYLIPSLFW